MTSNVLRGQTAAWLIPPKYDAIRIDNNEDIVVTDSVDQEIMWTIDGKRLAQTPFFISPFAEEKSVTLQQGSDLITGFYKKDGSFIKLLSEFHSIDSSYPYFSNGHLLVRDNTNFYVFIDTEGRWLNEWYVMAYPYSNGYASCRKYKSMIRQKATYNVLLDKEDQEVVFSFNGKTLHSDDLDFISSVNDMNIGIVIVKNKLYFFNGIDRSLEPVFGTKNEKDIKNQARLDKDLSDCLTTTPDSTSIVLRARSGKKGSVSIIFNTQMVPLSVIRADGEYTYKQNAALLRSKESPILIVEDNNKYGISIGEKSVLPPQLDEITEFWSNKAFVKHNGKYGMLKILDTNFRLNINEGKDIAFRHQKLKTIIRLDLPKEISAQNTRIQIDPLSGCDVDMPSVEKKDTEFGNYVQYKCLLTIPDSLPDEMYDDGRNEILYPTRILYDGLESPVIPFMIKAWHYKYFNVDIDESDMKINQGTLSFTFDINTGFSEEDYPKTVEILTDSLLYELDKKSEMRYKCTIYALHEGINNITIRIKEQGCPSINLPFEVTYSKPSKKENVVVKRKVIIKDVQSTRKPRIDI